jgi:outer membrane protein TolC
VDVVRKGRELLAIVDRQAKDLVPAVEVDRVRATLADMEQHAVSARQYWRRSSIDLTQVLRLDPRAVVDPLERDHLQITLIDPGRALDELIPIGLTNRPELAAHQALVQETLVAIKREKMRALLPSVMMNGFQTPYELLQFGALGIGNDSSINHWAVRLDVSPGLMWQADSLGLGNLAMIKRERGKASLEMVRLFQVQDAVAGDVTRAQASVQSAAARIVQAERELQAARVNFDGNMSGLKQTKRFGDVLQQIFRPQEAVFALQLLKLAYDEYFATVAEYNQAQFELFHALGYPARELAFSNRTGDVLELNTARPGYLPEVGTGPPPPTR